MKPRYRLYYRKFNAHIVVVPVIGLGTMKFTENPICIPINKEAIEVEKAKLNTTCILP